MEHDMTDEEFWTIVAELGWPATGYDQAKLLFMQRYDVSVSTAFSREFRRRKGALTKAAGVDWICDSWDDVRAHVIGLGKDEYDKVIANPQLIIDRERNGEYVESFAYCIPFAEDYAKLTDDGYAEMLAQVRQLMSEIKATDPDDVPPRLFRRFPDVLEVCGLLVEKKWAKAIARYHELFGAGYADDWPMHGYLVPNLVSDLEVYRVGCSGN